MLESDFHLYENIDILDTLKKQLNNEGAKKIYTIKPNYFYSFQGNRTLKLIPTEYLAYSNSNECGFFESIARLLFIGRDMIQHLEKINEKKMFIEGYKYIKAIAEYLETDEKTILQSFLMLLNSFEIKSDSKQGFFASAIALASRILKCDEKTIQIEGKINTLKIENYTKIFRMIIERIINNEELIFESNIMIVAVDEREFLINYIRKNDSSYCNFESIRNCPNIHKFKESSYFQKNKIYFDIIRKLCNNTDLSLDENFVQFKNL
ncbi:hypothetical protein M9Y10_014062 [Tritrichomonas musculus]|uniref:Uncharacterized protein n=1 Tax=Tritrichomonas musculus TaxID=1915356 RepID=A0ABR2KYH2_9EUKA